MSTEGKLQPQSYDYKAPALPAYTAAGLHYICFWMIPFWITEFTMYCVKSRAFQDGVSDGDWVVLFLWLVFEIMENFLGRTSIKKAECVLCSPFWLYLLFSIMTIFFTIYMIAIVNTVMMIEMVTCLVTVIIEVVMLLGVIASFVMSSRAPRINPGEYQ